MAFIVYHSAIDTHHTFDIPLVNTKGILKALISRMVLEVGQLSAFTSFYMAHLTEMVMCVFEEALTTASHAMFQHGT